MKARIRTFLKTLWMVVVAVFVVRYVARNWDELYDTVSSFSALVLVGTVAVTMAGKAFVCAQSRVTTRAFGAKFTLRESLWMYSASDLVKYVPGGVWNALARVRLYTSRGMAATAGTRAFALEKYWMLTGAVFTGLMAIAPDMLERIDVHVHGVSAWAVRIVLFILWGPAMFVGARVAGARVHPRAIALAMANELAMAVLFGLGVSIPLSAVHANIPTATAIGAFSIGRGMGYVAVFAPAGIGVREVVTLWALGGGHGAATDTMLIAMAVNRVMTLLADLLSFATNLAVRPPKVAHDPADSVESDDGSADIETIK